MENEDYAPTAKSARRMLSRAAAQTAASGSPRPVSVSVNPPKWSSNARASSTVHVRMRPAGGLDGLGTARSRMVRAIGWGADAAARRGWSPNTHARSTRWMRTVPRAIDESVPDLPDDR